MQVSSMRRQLYLPTVKKENEMSITIKNGELVATINENGAELERLVHVKTGENVIWCADKSVWGKTSPNLFPAIGVIKFDGYRYHDQFFPMSRHGFARDTTFAIDKQSNDSVVFKISDSAETRKMFPFRFTFYVGYFLLGNTLEMQYIVKNNDSAEMYFHLGGHTAFSTENGGTTMNDYALVFDEPTALVCRRLGGQPFTVQEGGENLGTLKRLPLAKTLFDDDAMMFEHIAAKGVTLESSDKKHRVRVEYPAFDHLAIWAAHETERYVCIEPWSTMPDGVHFDGEITTKPGIQKLAPNCERAYSIVIKCE